MAGLRPIGLAGRAGSGKSTAAGLLERAGYRILPFAAPMKRMLLALGVPERNIYGTQAEKDEPLDILCGRSARYALQRLGTEWGRDLIGHNLWINAWLADARAASGPICADDVRTAGEARAVQSLGGVVIRIVRPETAISRAGAHATEAQDFAADRSLLNSDTLDVLVGSLMRAASHPETGTRGAIRSPALRGREAALRS